MAYLQAKEQLAQKAQAGRAERARHREDCHERTRRRFLQGPPLETTLYPPGSRYHGVPLAEITLADGRSVRYLRRRLLPPTRRFATLLEHRVVDGDRARQPRRTPISAIR